MGTWVRRPWKFIVSDAHAPISFPGGFVKSKVTIFFSLAILNSHAFGAETEVLCKVKETKFAKAPSEKPVDFTYELSVPVTSDGTSFLEATSRVNSDIKLHITSYRVLETGRLRLGATFTSGSAGVSAYAHGDQEVYHTFSVDHPAPAGEVILNAYCVTR